MKFYTDAFINRGLIYYTGYEDGVKVQKKIKYEPYIFLPSNKETGWKTIEGQHVQKKQFESISDARQYVKEFKDVDNFAIYGNTNFLYTWLNDYFPGEIDFDISLISLATIDIEVESDQGLPNYRNPVHPINAITLGKNGKYVTFGFDDYKPKLSGHMFIRCNDEKDLLQKFLKLWNSDQYSPDVVTGWNIEFFDFPYLYNRLKFLFGEDVANKLSPWGMVEEREVGWGSKEQPELTYDLKGITILDYLQIYKKFTFTNHESYSLDYISSVELGKKKLDYSQYGNLLRLYRENYELFVDYNLRDCVLVDELEDKLKLIEQVFTLAYDGKVNYLDTLTTVRMWDTIIHNYLLDKFIVVPNPKKNQEYSELIGAYVKDPQVGLHKWVVSFDLTSLYPHLIMQYNISPDTFIKKIYGLSLDEVIEGKLDTIRDEIGNYSCTANLCLYSKDKQGFLAALMDKVYQDRFVYKKKMIEAKKAFENTDDEDEKKQLKKKIAQYHNLQMAKKIQLNSAYGAVANEYFRFYHHDSAEAITSSGQLAIRWVADRLNQKLNSILKTNKDYIIASDTDSIYISMDDFLPKVGLVDAETDKIISFIDKAIEKQLQPFIEQCYEELAVYTNAFQNRMNMKRECIAEKGIWTAKKRYILNVWDQEGVRYHEPELKLTGIEAVRSSTPSSCRDNIKKALSVIMNKDLTELRKFVNNFKTEFKQLPVEEIAFPRSISGLRKYEDNATIFKKATPIQVKGALIYNHLIQKNKLDKKYPFIYNGDKVKFAYLKTPNTIHQTVIAFKDGILPDEFELQQYIDYELQFQKGFLDPLRLILEVINWQLEEINTLEDFM